MQDRHIELLTAFIDGELTRRERIAVLRLLNQSSEARRMLWQLQQNSLVLKQLPAQTLPADFADKIVEIIVKTAAVPAPVPAEPARPAAARFGPRVAVRLAWAAGLLLAVVGSLFYLLSEPQTPQIAKNEEPPQKGSEAIVPREDLPTVKDAPKVEPKENPNPFAGRFVFAELKQPARRKLLEQELSKGKSVRVDLYVKNNRQAVDRLGKKLQFQANLTKTKDKVQRIFVENLAPADVAGFLGELAREDKGTFKDMQVQPMSGEDQKLLCGLLGIEPTELISPVERTKLPDIIEGKDKKDLSLPGPVLPQIPERRALLLTRDDAKQIRNFVDQRRLLKPGTVQILFVVHTAA